jgi:RNA polymerase sigma factor (TIGR02999 family)
MRRILVDHARRKQAKRRDGLQPQAAFRELPETSSMSAEELIALDEALAELARHYPRAGRIVELRFFGGLTEAETAEVLGISISTLKREWGFAKVWLLRQLSSAVRLSGCG